MSTIRLHEGKTITLGGSGLATTPSNPFHAGYVRWLATTAAYEAIYRNSPAVRRTVDFIARNCAMVALRVWKRIADDDREHLYDHPLSRTLRRPNKTATRFAYLRDVFSDLLIYDEQTSIVAMDGDGDMQLARIPPPFVQIIDSRKLADPPEFFVVADGARTPLAASARMYVHGYAPDRVHRGLAPMETLRNIIDEESAATESRRRMWEQGLATGGVIERPSTAPKWSPGARERFLVDWAQRFQGPANAGKTPLLEEDMHFVAASMTPEQAQYVEARKLTGQDVAHAFHLPLAIADLIDGAPMSDVKVKRQQLYADTLGPSLEMYAQEVTAQLVPRFDDDPDVVFAEFDLLAKLKGSFEEQTAVSVSAVGRPYMTPNEWRAFVGLDRLDDVSADRLSIPLNVMLGAAPDGSDDEGLVVDVVPASVTGAEGGRASRAALPTHETKQRGARAVARLRDRHASVYERQLAAFFEHQGRVLATSRGQSFDIRRWDRELTDDLRQLHTATTVAHAQLVSDMIGADFDPAHVVNYLAKAAANDARGVNRTTRDRMAEFGDPEDFEASFKTETAYRAGMLAVSYATQYGMFGAHEAAEQGGSRSKVWETTSQNSRHPDMDGERVPLGDAFSNGAMYPGDPAAGDDESAGCQCVVVFE